MNIILSSIKRGFRDKNGILSNIFLVLILPYIFSLIFSFEGGNEDISMVIVGDKQNQVINSYCEALEKFDDSDDKISIDYKIYSENNFDKYKLLENNDLVVKIDEKNKEVNFNEKDNLSLGKSKVKGIIEEFFNSLSVNESLDKEDYTSINVSKMIKEETYYDESTKSILDYMNYKEYFSLVMLEMAILVGSVYAFKNTFYIKGKLGDRVKISSIKTYYILLLEIAGSFFLIFIQGLIMLVAITLFYGVNVNTNNILLILSLIGVLSLLAVCLGIFATAISKKQSSGENICTFMVIGITLASGQLMPQISGDFDKMSLLKLNPFLWVSKELNNIVAYNSSENLLMTMGTSLVVSLILIIISIILLNRKVVR